MKSKLVIVTIVVIVILLGGFSAYTYTKQTGKTKNLAETISNIKQETKSDMYTDTLKNLVELGVPLKCNYNVAGNSFEGTLKGKNFKGAISMPDGRVGNIIMKDNCMYSWTEADTQGITLCYENESESFWEDPGNDLPQNYNCVPALVADSEFDLPKDINFMSLDDLMKNMQEYEMPVE